MIKREINFKVWDCYENKWREPFTDKLYSFCVFLERARFIILQFTGLYDKNKKPIYEGDIVKCSYGTGKVIFHAGCFMVEWISDSEMEMEFLFSSNSRGLRKEDEEFEVIGNIFENENQLRKT